MSRSACLSTSFMRPWLKQQMKNGPFFSQQLKISPRTAKETDQWSFLKINKTRLNMSKRRNSLSVPAACVFVFEVVQVNTAPWSSFHTLPLKWFFSALPDACSSSLVCCLYLSFHAEFWVVAPFLFIYFFYRDIERQVFQASAECVYHLSANRASLLCPMWLWRVIDREGLSVRYFKHVLCFTTPFSSLMHHAYKCCPVIGHAVLTNFITTNWVKVIGVMLKVLKEKKKNRVHQACEHFIIEPVSLSLFPYLPVSLSLSVTADCLQLWSFEAHYTCAHSSNSITSRLSVRSLEMSQWLSVSRVFSSILNSWWLLPTELV